MQELKKDRNMSLEKMIEKIQKLDMGNYESLFKQNEENQIQVHTMNIADNNYSSNDMKNNQNNNRRRQCYACKNFDGHIKFRCPNTPCCLCQQTSHMGIACPTAVCTICAGKGHTAHGCPDRDPDYWRKNKRPNNRGPTNTSANFGNQAGPSKNVQMTSNNQKGFSLN